MKRHFTRELDTEHDHAGDPEKDDVEPRHKYVSRIQSFQARSFLRPSKRRKGPQCG